MRKINHELGHYFKKVAKHIKVKPSKSISTNRDKIKKRTSITFTYLLRRLGKAAKKTTEDLRCRSVYAIISLSVI